MKPDTCAHFCVVGHPNKGKSSIVATLTEIDSIIIGPESGTTRSSDSFDFSVDQTVLLTLTDTPGFQRAREVLHWLQQQDVPPHARADRVRAFLSEPTHAQRFPDEVALLTPVMQGAGIVFITDASGPVSASDLAEMEILRWTGQPRMAVINPMGNSQVHANTYHAEWRQTLNQYFQWVREFDPLQAPLEARIKLLSAMSELLDSSTVPKLIDHLKQREVLRVRQLAEEVARYWSEQITRSLDIEAFSSELAAEQALQKALNEAETIVFQHWLTHFNYTHLAIESQPDWLSDYPALMNTEHWSYWGLRPQQLLWVTGAAGAAAGSLVDVGTAGGSMLLGAITGGVLGTASGWLMSKQVPGSRFKLPGVRKHQHIGPVKHPNFPFVLMARALSFVKQLSSRTHARRDEFSLRVNASDWTSAEQTLLLRWSKQLQAQKWNISAQRELEDWVWVQLNPPTF